MTRDAPPFVLDRFQREANAALDDGRSVLVAAPTGSGKTVVAEHAVDVALSGGGRAFYTTPIKALSNQKFADLSGRLGAANVGLLTGDHAIRGHAPVVVMTTEVLRNMIYANPRGLADLRFIILDEVHYLQDAYRGPVWEEVIIHAPTGARLVCLSATISNADEVAAWIESIRGPISTVVEDHRPVELRNVELIGDRYSPELLRIPTLVDGRPNPRGSQYDAPPVPKRGGRGRPRRRYRSPRRLEVVEHLADDQLLPAIYFVFSRNGCEEAARAVADGGQWLTAPAERRRIRSLVESKTAELSDADLDVLGYDRWLSQLEQGIAAHHAGMVPAFREAVEACFVEGLVKVVFATETLALGINMPARSVVIESLSKFNGEHHEALRPSEYTQLTGRAGRRGIDELGHALVLWSPFVAFDQVAALAASRDFELQSAFRPNYNMAANLVRRHSTDEAHELLRRSLAQYQADRSLERLQARREALGDRLAGLDREARCELGDVGEYRSLLAARDAARSQPNGNGQGREAAARLKPGDVIRAGAPHGRLAILGVGFRRGGNLRVRAVTTQGKLRTLGADDFERPPDVIGAVSLPVPYRPDDAAYHHEVGSLLARASVRSGRRRHQRPAGGDPASGSPPQPRATGVEVEADDHPVARCPDRKRHLRAASRAELARQQLADLDRRMATRSGSLSARFDRVLDVLRRWHALDDWSLTSRGELLARTYHESDLLVATALADGLFDDLGADQLAGLVSVFTYEHRSRFAPPARWFPNVELRGRFEQAEALGAGLNRDERHRDLPETRPPDATFLPLAVDWARGVDLDRVLDEEELSAGDFVRNVKQVIDLTRQIAELAPKPTTRAAADQAVQALRRGVVAAASGLGTGVDEDLGEGADDLDDHA